jgi:HSP20 family molecular chaperone IbpA
MKHQDSNQKPFFDWDSFQEQFARQGAWKEALNPSWSMPWLEQYVRQLIEGLSPNIRPEGPVHTSARSVSSVNLLETQSLIIVRIKAARPVDTSTVRFSVGGNELRVQGLPGEEEKVIQLPSLVKASGSRVYYKDGLFEVRLPKKGNIVYTDIPLQFQRTKSHSRGQ